MSQFVPPHFSPSIENSPETNVELAYRCMISELATSFLHEFNNPLTVLASSAALLENLRSDDDTHAEIVQNMAEGSDDLVRLSNAFRAALKASPERLVRDPQRLCEQLLVLSGYRLKNAGLSFDLSIEPMAGLVLSERAFLLVFYSMLELCTHASETYERTPDRPEILRISLKKAEAGHCMLVWLDGKPRALKYRKTCAEISELPRKLLPFTTRFFPFVLAQSMIILQQCGSSLGWQMDDIGCAVEAAIPAK